MTRPDSIRTAPQSTSRLQIQYESMRMHLAWPGILFVPWFLLAQASTDVSQQSRRLCQTFCGVYEVTPGWILTLAMQGPDLVYQDFHSGRVGLLHPSGETALVVGPNLSVSTPVETTFQLAGNSTNSPHLIIEQKGYPRRHARKFSPRQEEVSFRNGSVTLAGTLTLPKTNGPYPVIVIIPGGGPQDRNDLQIGW